MRTVWVPFCRSFKPLDPPATSRLEQALGPGWRERLAAAALPGAPRLFGTHGGTATWPPDIVTLGQIHA